MRAFRSIPGVAGECQKEWAVLKSKWAGRSELAVEEVGPRSNACLCPVLSVQCQCD